MPTYLCHGFRWHRKSILYFILLQDLEDASPQWIMSRRSGPALLSAFCELYDFMPPSSSNALPADKSYTNARQRLVSDSALRDNPSLSKIPASIPADASFNDWSVVKLLEEYNAADETTTSAPWAYVADHVVKIDTSMSIAEEMARYEENGKAPTGSKLRPGSSNGASKLGLNNHGAKGKTAGWFDRLRDQLQREEDIKWYIVVCGDEQRGYDEEDEEDEYEEDDELTETEASSIAKTNSTALTGRVSVDGTEFRLPELIGVGSNTFKSEPLARRQPVEKKPPVPQKDFPPALTASNHVNVQDASKGVASLDLKKGSKPHSGLRKFFSRKHPESAAG